MHGNSPHQVTKPYIHSVSHAKVNSTSSYSSLINPHTFPPIFHENIYKNDYTNQTYPQTASYT